MEIDFIRRETAEAWDWLESIVRDVTDEQANWWPAGVANSIGCTYVHIVINTDVEINRLLYSRDPLIETQWGGHGGIGVPYDPDRFDDTWVRRVRVDWKTLRDYGRAVHRQLLDSLAELREEHLELPVDMTRAGLGVWKGRDLYRLHGWNHVRMHGGEIACLKGLRGAKGYVDGLDANR